MAEECFWRAYFLTGEVQLFTLIVACILQQLEPLEAGVKIHSENLKLPDALLSMNAPKAADPRVGRLLALLQYHDELIANGEMMGSELVDGILRQHATVLVKGDGQAEYISREDLEQRLVMRIAYVHTRIYMHAHPQGHLMPALAHDAPPELALLALFGTQVVSCAPFSMVW
jgi:hypothetical protein